MFNKGGSFFLQAGDGIRDVAVTGVQTCALPISAHRGQGARHVEHLGQVADLEHAAERRSEERRVGKECRPRWSPYHKKQNQNVSVMVFGNVKHTEAKDIYISEMPSS